MYVHRQITGDTTIVARVLSIANAASPSARAGVLIRQDLSTTSPFIFAAVTPTRGTQYLRRNSNGGLASGADTAGAPPEWVRLQRVGSTITAARSRDRNTWVTLGTSTLASGSPVYVGLAVASQSSGSTVHVSIDDVTVTGGTSPTDTTPPLVGITSPAHNSQASGAVTITAGASDDVGVTSVTFRVNGAIVGSPDTTLPYSVVWNSTVGSHTLTAEAADAAGNRTTSAPISVNVAAANQPPTASITAPSDGATYTAPASVAISANASDPDGTISRVDFFAGATQIGYDSTSPYAFTWSNVQQGTHVITAVARDNGGASTSSAAIAVTVNPGPTGTWTSTNVGNPSPAGSMQETNGTFTVQGSGSIGGTSEQFMFVHRQVTGDVTIVARVLSIANAVSNSARVGVMLRESLTTAAPFALAAVTPARGTQLMYRNSGGGMGSRADTAGAPPDWVRLERRGSVVTASRSPDGAAWTTVGTASLSSSAPMFVGLAVISQSSGSSVTGTLDSVSISGGGSGGGDTTPPTVSVTAPANNSQVSGAVTISANAADNVGVASVTFRVDGTTIGSADTTAPYSAVWNATAGTHVITAEAADAAGNRTTSGAVTVTVQGADQPPTVALTGPSNGATFTAPASIAMTATAGDSDGIVAQVDFYAGSTLLGSDTSSPYAYTWSGAAAGTYSLTAVARDNAGLTTTSSPVSVTVNGSQSLSRAVFNPSAEHSSTTVTNYELEIFTSGADPNTATPVQTRDLGKPAVVNGECSVDIAATIQALPGGTYIATVRAIGPGGFARSVASAPFTR